MSNFVLSDYVQTTFLNRKDCNNCPINVELENEFNVNEEKLNKCSYLILVDLSVRTFNDLEAFEWLMMNKFINKLKSSDQDVSGDKFLHIHDIGDNNICNVGIARIPSEMYQKLDLGKNVINNGIGNGDLLQVVMLSQYGDRIMNIDMAEAIMSAYQMSRFSMPTMKSNSNSKKNDDNNVNYKSTKVSNLSSKPRGIVRFLKKSPLPPELDEYMINNKDNSNVNKEQKVKEEIVDEDNLSLEQILIRQRKDKENKNSGIKTSNEIKEENIDCDNNIDNIDEDEAAFYQHLTYAAAVNEGTNMARALSSLPPNVLSPGTFCNVINRIAKGAAEHGLLQLHSNDKIYNNVNDNDDDVSTMWEYDEWTADQLADFGCGAFHAVTRGNPLKQDRLVRLKIYSVHKSQFNQDSTNLNNNNNNDNGNDNNNDIRVDNDGNTPSKETKKANKDVIFSQTVVPLSDLYSMGNGGASVGSDLNRPLVLVGKGVTFDTGGVNIKSANSMKTMKHDMGGAAATLGMAWALARSGYKRPIECWLAVVENNIDSRAYRPDEVITSVTGDTIEVVHTDAEGRMILADTLAIASRRVNIPSIHGNTDFSKLSPKLMIDAATLTGTCISSLSNRYIGVFTNRDAKIPLVIKTGSECGERLWPFPLDDDYNDDLKSDIADVLQCRQPTEADHIYASSFMKRFVSPSVSWFHLDLGSAHRPGGLGHVSTDYTGSGVRAGCALIKKMIE